MCVYVCREDTMCAWGGVCIDHIRGPKCPYFWGHFSGRHLDNLTFMKISESRNEKSFVFCLLT